MAGRGVRATRCRSASPGLATIGLVLLALAAGARRRSAVHGARRCADRACPSAATSGCRRAPLDIAWLNRQRARARSAPTARRLDLRAPTQWRPLAVRRGAACSLRRCRRLALLRRTARRAGRSVAADARPRSVGTYARRLGATVTAYLDHAATTPMLPEARRGDDRAARRASATPRRCTPPAAAPAGSSRSPARRIAAALGARPGEVVFTSGGTEADNLARQGHSSGPAATPTRARVRVAGQRRSSTTPCSTRVDWLGDARGRRGRAGCRSTRCGRVDRRRAARRRRARPRRRSRWSSVMWANNEVGTRAAGRRGRRASRTSTASRSTPTPCRRRPGAGRLRRVRRRRADRHRPQARRPARRRRAASLGATLTLDAAAARRRPGARRPLRHARRRRRSPASRPPSSRPSAPARARPARLAALRDELVARVARGRCPTRDPATATRRRHAGCPATRTARSPAARATRCCCCSTPGIECSTGSACSAGVPAAHPRAARDGARPRRRRAASLRFSLGHTSTDGRRRRARSRRSGRSSSGPARRPADAPVARSMRVLAAMSGGVDSAVAAARRSRPATTSPASTWRCRRNPPSLPLRRARLLHHRGRPRRPARRRRARHPVLRLGPGRAVPARTWSRTSWPSTPPGARPTRACAATRRSSSPPCSTGRWRSASTPSPPATTPGSSTGPTGRELHRAVDPAKDQSYVLGVLDRRPAAPRAVPARRHDQGRGPRRGRARAGCSSPTSPTATTSASSPTATPRGWLRERLGERARRASSTPTGRRWSAPHDGAYALHRRPAPGAAARPRRPPTASRATCSTSSRSPTPVTVGAARRCSASTASTATTPRWCGAAPVGEVRLGAQVRAHGAEVPATVPSARRGCRARRARRAGAGRRARAGGGALRRHPGRRLGDDPRHRPRLKCPRRPGIRASGAVARVSA